MFISECASVRNSKHTCVSLSLSFFCSLFLCGFVWAFCGRSNVAWRLWVAVLLWSEKKNENASTRQGWACWTFLFSLPQFFFQKHSTCIVTMLLAAMAAFCREMEISRPNSVLREVPLFLVYTNLFFYSTCHSWFNGALLHSMLVGLRVTTSTFIVLLYIGFSSKIKINGTL